MDIAEFRELLAECIEQGASEDRHWNDGWVSACEWMQRRLDEAEGKQSDA